MNFWDKIYKVLIDFSGWSFFEILFYALIIYGILLFLKNARALRAVKYIVALAAVYLFIQYFSEKLPALNIVADLFGIACIIVFCIAFVSEIRRTVLRIISPRKAASHYTTNAEYSDEEINGSISEIIKAAQTLSKNNIGALIVIDSNAVPTHIIESGVKLNSIISAALLDSIFNTKSPLHDGAVIINGNKLVAAGCFLPLSQDLTLPKELGTRHRAALGMTENYDVLTIIVSEETGVISIAAKGELKRYFDSNMLHDELTQFYGLTVTHLENNKRRRK